MALTLALLCAHGFVKWMEPGETQLMLLIEDLAWSEYIVMWCSNWYFTWNYVSDTESI